MKQNEKILVYAVTGFLAVILGVAILFGKDSTRRLPDVRTDVAETPSLEALLDRRAAENKAVDASASGATQTGARTYKITAKDSLWKIAEREVGKAKAYAYVEKILDANPNLDAERLRLGQTITLPAKD